MLKAIRNLDYAILLCQDVETQKHFYQHVLGFPLYRDFGTWVELRVGASLLTLARRGTGYEGVREQHGAPPVKAQPPCNWRSALLQRRREDCFAELQQKGVAILQPPTDQATGHRTLFFKDPEGTILEIYADL